ncbi:hypothetical protein E7Z53_19245 [Kocuria salina]|uniref:hypothetical protein n=1 Tax=Kocuria salina TaxID=1929416 RepID=UPI001592E65A|nr:hypothetical protein [Kocuria salina]NVC25550.1 hypothetical protein [Kocuria salina]
MRKRQTPPLTAIAILLLTGCGTSAEDLDSAPDVPVERTCEQLSPKGAGSLLEEVVDFGDEMRSEPTIDDEVLGRARSLMDQIDPIIATAGTETRADLENATRVPRTIIDAHEGDQDQVSWNYDYFVESTTSLAQTCWPGEELVLTDGPTIVAAELPPGAEDIWRLGLSGNLIEDMAGHMDVDQLTGEDGVFTSTQFAANQVDDLCGSDTDRIAPGLESNLERNVRLAMNSSQIDDGAGFVRVLTSYGCPDRSNEVDTAINRAS